MQEETTRSNKPFFRLILGSFVVATIFVLLLAISSCNTAKKLDKIHFKKEALTASKCSVWYPIKDSSFFSMGSTDTQYIQGQTVYVNCDSLDMYGQPIYGVGITVHDTLVKRYKIPCPNTKVITVHDTIHVLRENEAKVMALNDTIKQFEAKLDNAEHAKKVWREWALYSMLCLLIIILLIGIIRYFKI